MLLHRIVRENETTLKYFWVVIIVVCFGQKTSAQELFIDEASGVQYQVEQYKLANFPVGMVFAPDGRLFYTEKLTGNVRVIKADGTRQIEPVIHLPTSGLIERGMTGIALDPNFHENHFVWIFHTAEGSNREFPANKIVRFREMEGIGHNPEVMLSVPIENGNAIHNGGNLHFNDEGYLYVSFGDFGEPENSQNLETVQGAIHRFIVTENGLEPAPDNPFENNSIFAYGFRNSFDFAFDPINGNLFATENGDDCDDEVNLVLSGFNYGWSEEYECSGYDVLSNLSLYSPPILSVTPTEALTGIVFYGHPAIPEWQGNLFFCGWNFGTLWRAELNERRTRIEQLHEIDLGSKKCRIDLIVGPDGALYFGSVGNQSGEIVRLIPFE